MRFALDPLPFDEASALIADKPAVTRAMFDQLPPEMKARAFTITGIEDFDTLQAVRDEIAKLPQGADWNAVKKEVAAKISPWFDPEEGERRAGLLLNHHAFGAYATCQQKMMDGQADIFTHRQYLTAKDDRVRAAHAALDGIILPAKDPFWKSHTPPWQFRCRCHVVPILGEEADEEKKKDESRNPEDRRCLEGAALEELRGGHICRGPDCNHVLGPSIMDVEAANLPFHKIAERWDQATRDDFHSWASKVPLGEDGANTLWGQLTGETAVHRPLRAQGERPATFAAALHSSGLAEKPVWSRADVANLRASLKVANPADARDLIKGIEGGRLAGPLTDKEIRRTVQDMLDILPREIADKLPPLQIKFIQRFTKVERKDGIDRFGKDETIRGDYAGTKDGEPRIRISMDALKGLTGEPRRREMRRILSHELMHWVHADADHPKAVQYREAIRHHYQARCTGEELKNTNGVSLREDHWWTEEAGVEYGWEHGDPHGMEVPARHFEMWETPDKITKHSRTDSVNSKEFRETFALVHSIFDQP